MIYVGAMVLVVSMFTMSCMLRMDLGLMLVVVMPVHMLARRVGLALMFGMGMGLARLVRFAH